MTAPPIALLTDFGTEDTYVGVMKGVIADIAPTSPIFDVTHAVPQGDIRQGAFKLWQSIRFFPKGTVFVVVIDPGVGTDRRAVAFSWKDRLVVGPDNGVFTYLLMEEPAKEAAVLENHDYQLHVVSTTFHGRDIFAPAGGHLAAGVRLQDFGDPAGELIRFPLPRLDQQADSAVDGEILHVDHFGNLISSIGFLKRDRDKIHIQSWMPEGPARDFPAAHPKVLLPDGRKLDLEGTFSDVPQGDLVAYIGSEAMLEVAVNRGNAARALGLGPGDPVKLTFDD